ncbi:MAG: hypothetical protein GX633_01325 [Clostridiales bacterium]|nr:hypothetical protein [Clostridiales bacterium]
MSLVSITVPMELSAGCIPDEGSVTMEWSKAKNIIILLLVGLNLFLLGTLGSMYRDERDSYIAAAEGAVRYLESMNISIDKSVIPLRNSFRKTMVIERDQNAETAFASALVGGSDVKNPGASYTVSGDWGSITWHPGALLDGEFTYSGLYNGGNEEVLIAYLHTAGIETAGYVCDYENNSYKVTLTRAYNRISVMNCILTFHCHNDDRVLVSGRWYVGDALPLSDKTESDPAGLIIKFVDHMQGSGIVISSIDIIENGYMLQQMTNIGVTLLPVVKITTDAGVAYIDAIDAHIVLNEIMLVCQ